MLFCFCERDEEKTTVKWFYSRMVRIPYTDQVSNKEILKKTATERTLLLIIKKRQMKLLEEGRLGKVNTHGAY